MPLHALSPPSPIVGVFDSGIGGLSVLRELQAQLPAARIHYVADSAYAPYGERDDAYVADRSLRIAKHLVAQNAAVLVVACNTATAAAVRTLRETWPGLAVVGVEPGIKPAVRMSRNRRIGVLATPGTLQSEKFHQLLQAQANGAQVVLQACPGLAALIELGDFHSNAICDAVHEFCAPLLQAQVDTVVLGCTHYPFIRHVIEHELGPSAQIVDTAEAVARQAARLFKQIVPGEAAWLDTEERLHIATTGDPETIRHAVSMMCGSGTHVEHVSLDERIVRTLKIR